MSKYSILMDAKQWNVVINRFCTYNVDYMINKDHQTLYDKRENRSIDQWEHVKSYYSELQNSGPPWN
jgi:hypothetical protein